MTPAALHRTEFQCAGRALLCCARQWGGGKQDLVSFEALCWRWTLSLGLAFKDSGQFMYRAVSAIPGDNSLVKRGINTSILYSVRYQVAQPADKHMWKDLSTTAAVTHSELHTRETCGQKGSSYLDKGLLVFEMFWVCDCSSSGPLSKECMKPYIWIGGFFMFLLFLLIFLVVGRVRQFILYLQLIAHVPC